MSQQSLTGLKTNLSPIVTKTPSTKVTTPVAAIAFPSGERDLLVRLVRQLPVSLGLTYLVLEYPGAAASKGPIDPGNLRARLEEETLMPVFNTENGALLERDCLYLVPATTLLKFEKGHIWFTFAPGIGKELQSPDHFFATVSAGFGECSAVIFAPDDTGAAVMGLRAIQDEGGLTVVLKDTAAGPIYPDSMPFVDLVLPAAEVATELKVFIRYLRPELRRREEPADERTAVSTLCRLVQQKKAADLSRFPAKDVLRRIRRRMGVRGIDSLSAYMNCVQSEEEELSELYNEIRTTLSAFESDPVMKNVLLKDVLLPILQCRPGVIPLRIWIPRCTDGHCAHGIAIAILEFLEERQLTVPLQIFSTDFNKQGINRARLGVYQEQELNNVSLHCRKKYFVQKGKEFHVVKAVRDICIFAAHNLLKDPPFSHVDIVFAPHVMAGLENGTRKILFRTFQFALNECGILLLDRARPQDFPGELFHLRREMPGILAWKQARFSLAPSYKPPIAQAGEQEASDLLLSKHVPASFLVDEQFRVLRYYGNTQPYLRRQGDKPSLNLLRLITDELVFELDDLFNRTEKEGRPLKKNSLPIGNGKDFRLISLEIVPLVSFGRKWRLIIIREKPDNAPEIAGGSAKRVSAKDLRIRGLEGQLQEMHGLLLAANDETRRIQEAMQQSNEDTLSSNEELQSVNEELHMMNQELAASKDDLLSFNAELVTINEDLHYRNRDLQASVEYAHTIIASLRRPIVVLQEDLHIRVGNPSFCHFFRLPQNIKGQHLYTVGRGIFHIPELHALLDNWKGNKAGPVDMELRHNFPLLGEKILRLNISSVPGLTGYGPGILLAIDDITEQKMVERFKDEFIGIASHELKTPATSIQAYSQLLYNELAKGQDEQSAMLVSRLNNQVTRLTRLAKDLLDITRINQGQTGLNRSYFDINALITEVSDELKIANPGRIVVAELPPAPRLLGDRERIAQVLVNILTNALKYSSGKDDIMVSTSLTEGHIRIAIRDAGIGMAPETLQKIFDRFYRSEDPSSIHHPGIGLGLYISSEIVRRHGGSITVDSEKGKGSVFTVILPFS